MTRQPPRRSKRLIRFVVMLCLGLISVGGAGVAFGTAWGWQFFIAPLNTHLAVEVETPEPSTDILSQRVVTVIGASTLPSEVELILNDIPLQTTQTDAAGTFQFDNVLLRPGSNEMKVEARTVFGWRSLEAETYAFYTLHPDPPTQPIMLELPSTVNRPALIVSGTADPRASVMVTVTGGIRSEVEADETGRFRAEVTFPRPGLYGVQAQAKNSKGTTSLLTRSAYITYDPAFGSIPALPITRAVTTTLAYRDIDIAVQTTLPKDDPRAMRLVTGQQTLPQFMRQVFGDYAINNTPIYVFFFEVTPAISISSNSITVRASQHDDTYHMLPISNGTLRVEKSPRYRGLESQEHFPLDNRHDTFTLVARDYELLSLNPPPRSSIDHTVVWQGNPNIWDRPHGIEVRLRYNVLNHPRWLLDLSLYDLIRYPATMILEFIYGLLTAIPLFWMLWLLRTHLVVDWLSDNFRKQCERWIQWLLVICFIPRMMALVDAVAFSDTVSTVWYGIGGPIAQLLHLRQIMISLIVLVALALLLWIVVMLRSVWLRVSLRALVLGMIGAAQFSAAIHAIALAFNALNINGASYLTVLIIFLLFWVLIGQACRAFQLHVLPGVSWLGKVKIVLIPLAVVLVYPFGTTISSVSDIRPSDVFVANVQTFLYSVQPLIPSTVLFGIMLVLRLAKDREGVSKPTIYQLSVLLFTAYVVGTTSNWLLIPVPFLLALWVFPRFVLLPRAKRLATDLITPQLFEERRKWLMLVLTAFGAKQFRSALDKLEKKVVAGDLSFTDFVQRKAEIEEYVANHAKERTLAYGVQARDVVLGIGPRETHWENGVWAVKHGFVLALPLLAIYFTVSLWQDVWLQSPFFLLLISQQLLIYVVNLLIAAFFFGYFFSYIRGESGLKKGMYFALAIVFCLLPSWLASFVTNAGIFAFLLWSGQRILFFTLLGLWAFDYRTFSLTLGEQFEWRSFTKFGNMPSLTAVASILLTSAGLAISSALTGQFTTIVSLIIQSAIPDLPIQPPR